MDPLELGPLTAEDAAALARLAALEGRNLHEREIARFLALEGAAGVALRQGGELLGAVTAIRYFEHGFLGPLMLRDGVAALGLGAALAAHAVDALRRSGAARVEAEATGEESLLLRGLGFEEVRRTLVLERPPGPLAARGATVALEARHLLDAGALDAAAAGHGRKEYLWALREEFPQGARALERGDDLAGYALMRRSRRGYHLGPLVTDSDDADAARAILVDAVASAATWPVVALAPEGTPLLDALREEGFAEVGALARLRAGPPPDPADGPGREWLLGGRLTG